MKLSGDKVENHCSISQVTRCVCVLGSDSEDQPLFRKVEGAGQVLVGFTPGREFKSPFAQSFAVKLVHSSVF